MSVTSMLEEMKKRTFSAAYDEYIQKDYDEWANENYDVEEGEYGEAMQVLPEILSNEQMGKLKEMEEKYRQNLEYASRYGFEAGLFSGFNQYFAGADVADEGLEANLMKNLLEMPGMQRHFGFHERNTDILRLGEELEAELSEENHEHVISVECAWGQRIHSAACQGFYCGYRASLQVIDTIRSLDSTKMIRNTLALEYQLGYIRSYEQKEREKERTAHTA